MRTLHMLRQLTLVQFKAMYRNRSALIFNLIIPLAFLVLFGALFGNSDVAPHIKVGLVDQDHGTIATALQNSLSAGGLDVLPSSLPDAEEGMRKGNLQAVIIAPPGTSAQAALQQAPAALRILYDPSSQTAKMALGQIQNVVGRLNADIHQTRPAVVAQPEQLPETEHLTIMDYLMPGELAFMLLNANIIGVIIGLASARQNGTLRHQLSTPLPAWVLLTSRILANLLMGLVQCGFVIAAGMLWFHAQLPSNLAGTLVVLAVSVLCTAGIGMAVGSLFKSVESAQPIGVVISMSLAFLGNAMMPLDNAPPLMLNISKVLPSSYITHALRGVMMQGQSVRSVALDLVILASWALVLISFGSWQLRRQTTAA